jgi:hypothetical protein
MDNIIIASEINLEDLIENITRNVDIKQIEEFIFKLDELVAEWGLTENLYNHFSELHKKYLNECIEVGCPECGSEVHIVDNNVDGHYVGCNKCEWCRDL